MGDLSERLNAKRKSMFERTYGRGWISVELITGRKINLQNLEQHRTYSGMLEGLPSPELNDRIIECLVSSHTRYEEAPLVIHAPRGLEHLHEDEKPAFERSRLNPEILPCITCIGSFESNEPTARGAVEDEDACASRVKLIWFQDEWAMPIAPEIIEKIKAFDWDSLAYDIGPP